MLQLKCFTFNPFAENTYVLHSPQGNAIVIDPGMYQPNEYKMLEAYLSNNNLKLQQVINTHCHLDHVFGLPQLLAKHAVPFAFNEAEQSVYDWAGQAGERYGVPIIGALPKATHYISEQDIIMLDEYAINILFTPGHSPGHLCFYNKAQGFVIAGDTLFQGSIGRTDLPGGHHATLINSIHTQLLSLPNETIVYSGHGPSTTIGIERMNNPFLQ
jgi:hydroxyacylglutathione hydrolase